MGQKTRMRIRKRRKKIAEIWDFLASKPLISGEPSKLCSDVRTTLKMLNIPWSSKNRERYLAAMHRAVGAKSCAPLQFMGTRTGRWTFNSGRLYSGKLRENLIQQNYSTIEARVMASREEQWRKMHSDVLDSWRYALTCYGTSTLRSKDGRLSPVDIYDRKDQPHDVAACHPSGEQVDDRSEREAVAPESAGASQTRETNLLRVWRDELIR